LYFGESNLPTPENIKQAAIRFMREGFTFYTENAGLPSLLRALADHYRLHQQVELDPATEIVVTPSGVQALHLCIRTLFGPREEARALTTVWHNVPPTVMGDVPTVAQFPHPWCGERYGLDLSALKAPLPPRSRLLLYTSPSNPLGWVATVEEQQGLL